MTSKNLMHPLKKKRISTERNSVVAGSISRLYYIDNLRIFLISLVVLHHLAITYGAPGGWYYVESEAGIPEVIPLAMFVATNQSFFMGMFFFISALFIMPSLKRKGTRSYIRERLLRLGIPLIVFFFVISPLTVFIVHKYIQGRDVTSVQYLLNGHGAGFGPMWFVEALLIFSFVFLLVKQYLSRIHMPFPGTVKILTVAVVTGLLQFVIRIWLPVGWSMPFTSFQFPFFVQYILLFAMGIIAWQNNWLESVSFEKGKKWFLFSQALIFAGFPLLFIGGGAATSGTEAFMGGVSWQSLMYALWEQMLGFSLIIGLSGIFKKFFNRQGLMAQHLSGSAYTVFITHTLILVALSAVFITWQPHPVFKLAVLAPMALVLCFTCALLLRRLPMAGKIL